MIYQNEPEAQRIALKGWRTGDRLAVSLRVMRCPHSSSTHYHLVPDGEDLIPTEDG